MEAGRFRGEYSIINERLKDLIADGITPILPFEVDVVRERFELFAAEQARLGHQLGEAMRQSSETWHDNAPADVINLQAGNLSTRAKKLTQNFGQTVEVEYPPLGLDVTIGSIVGLVFEGQSEVEYVLITGLVDEVPGSIRETLPIGTMVVTIQSPIGRALLGAKNGEMVNYKVRDRNMSVIIMSKDQLQPPGIS